MVPKASVHSLPFIFLLNGWILTTFLETLKRCMTIVEKGVSEHINFFAKLRACVYVYFYVEEFVIFLPDSKIINNFVMGYFIYS